MTVTDVSPDAIPPVMLTLLAFCVDIVPRPVIAVLGIVAAAVNAPVPLPYTYPVNDVAPVPPWATFSVPFKVTAPEVAVEGVNPVRPALNVDTPEPAIVIEPGPGVTVIPDPAVIPAFFQ